MFEYMIYITQTFLINHALYFIIIYSKFNLNKEYEIPKINNATQNSLLKLECTTMTTTIFIELERAAAVLLILLKKASQNKDIIIFIINPYSKVGLQVLMLHSYVQKCRFMLELHGNEPSLEQENLQNAAALNISKL